MRLPENDNERRRRLREEALGYLVATVAVGLVMGFFVYWAWRYG